jgi:N-acyl homoserine lactone hydrolase
LSTVRPLHFCDVTVDGQLWPVYGWAIDGPDGTILVDTGMIDSTPELDEEWEPVLLPWPEVGDVAAVINTHLHFDHCGGNRRFAGVPTYVQRTELETAVAPNYLEEWVRFPGESYVEVDGDAELFPGVSVHARALGRSPGSRRTHRRRSRRARWGRDLFDARADRRRHALDSPDPCAATRARVPRAPRKAVAARARVM